MKFNKPTKEHIVEVSDIVNTIPITEKELSEHFDGNSDSWLRFLTRKVYDIAYEAHQRDAQSEHNECVRWIVHTDGKARRHLVEAVAEMVMASYNSDLDLKEYMGEKVDWTFVKQKLAQGEIYVKGYLECEPER